MHALQDLNQFLRPFVKVPQSLCRGVARIQLDRGGEGCGVMRGVGTTKSGFLGCLDFH